MEWFGGGRASGDPVSLSGDHMRTLPRGRHRGSYRILLGTLQDINGYFELRSNYDILLQGFFRYPQRIADGFWEDSSRILRRSLEDS